MKWCYKTVHFELKKEGLLGSGFLDESEIELELNEFGQRGWELISVLEVQDGIIVFFKQPLYLADSSSAHQIENIVREYGEEDVTEQNNDQIIEEDSLADDRSAENPSNEESVIGAIKIE